MHKLALRLSSVTIVLIFLVILAGSIVRTTGAGMGCPDWPKCFGYLIPPTDPETLTYREGKSFAHGQMVVRNDTLWVAKSDLVAGATFDRSLWSKYERHDYATFNTAHTWTEYINRLIGALSGMAAFALLIASFMVRRSHKQAWWYAAGAVIMIGVAAWLGKVVVDRKLHEGTITLHMLCSMAILLLLVLTRVRLKPLRYEVNHRFRIFALISLFVLTAQILLGTSVREHVDMLLAAGTRESVMDTLIANVLFIIHRSASLLIMALATLMFRASNHSLRPTAFLLFILLLVIEIAAGMILAYLDLPEFAQPIHLVMALGMFSSLWYLVVTSRVGTA
ncbi:MAG: COX15/CtaA family protein [Flavobacteriales bacterium]|nr:COX15/CtaA family protein [Flavobacteriales bacterium]